MRIGIDVRYALHTRRGIGNYILNLVHNLATIDSDNQYFLYSDIGDIECILPQQKNFKFTQLSIGNIRKDNNQTKSKLFALWEQLLVPQQAKKDELDILHCPGNTAPLFLDKSIQLVVTLHDVMFLLPHSVLPQVQSLYSTLFRLYCQWVLPRIPQHSLTIITVSNYSKKDIIKYLKINPQIVKVIYEGIDSKFKIKKITPAKNKFILAFGGHEVRKNCLRTIDAFVDFSQNNPDYFLVLCGMRDDYKILIEKYITSKNIQNKVTLLSYVSDAELVSLYNAADILLYPSLYEGFGFPVLESMACGTPVISSNTTSIPEITEDAALLIDPSSVKEISNALIKITTDKSLRKTLLEKSKQRVLEFSWLKTAKETKDLYENLMI
jgi:glycosyltransferase involved in cell wall biosynthesis